jgi:hypothetical protein
MGLLRALGLPALGQQKQAGAAASGKPTTPAPDRQPAEPPAGAPPLGSLGDFSGDQDPASTPDGDEPSVMPGVSKDKLRKALRASLKPEPSKPIVFEPKVRVLTDVYQNATPNLLPQGEEMTIDLLIDNWEEEAPDSATTNWTIQVQDLTSAGTAVVAAIAPDPSTPSKAYLTVTGKRSAAVSAIVVSVTVKLPDAQPKTKVMAAFMFSCDTPLQNDPDIDKARRADGGGAVTQTDLDQDLTNLLQDWMQAATIGISQFATASLESKINSLSEIDKRTFFLNLIGNVLWAATVFNIGGSFALKLAGKIVGAGEPNKEAQQRVVSFVISMAGIVGPAVDSFVRAGAGANTIDDVRKAMDGANEKWYQYMQVTLAGKINGLADKITTTSRYEATNQICQAMFKPGTVKTDAKGQLKPTINMPVVSNRYRAIAMAMLEKYQAESSKTKLERAIDDFKHKQVKDNKQLGDTR